MVYLKNKLLKLDNHTLEVVKKSSASIAVKIGGMLIGLVVSISLGYLIGADGVGIIGLSNRIVSLLMVLALLGLPQVIIKKVAIAKNESNFQQIGDVLHTVNIVMGLLSFLLTIILIVLSPWISNYIFNEPSLVIPLIISAIVMPAQVFSRIFGSALVGYKKIWQSNLVDQTLSAVVTGSLLLISWLCDVGITVNLVAVFYAVGRIVVTITVSGYWKTLYQFKGVKNFISKELLKTSIPLLFVSMTLLLASSIDAIMLGWLSNVTEVGYYTIALQLALLTSFFLQVANSVLMPKIAALYSSKKLNEMRIMVQRTTHYLILIGILMVGLFIIIGKPLLGLWGEEFKQAFSILIILSIGQFFNIASGPIGSLLIMCNYEKVLRNITITSLVLNVLLNYFLIKYYGANGAAIATAITIAIIMVLSSFFVKIKLGFFAFGNK
ncbi:oligosaccharide flippase family protein [Winogradskyella sp.]|nr:oligosaccharide flippase family protein [Winogradskyella sp.]